jgi:hypothetical protein
MIEIAPSRICTIAALLLGLAGCSSKNNDLFDDAQGAAGDTATGAAGAAGAAGASGNLDGVGGYGFLDGNNGGTSSSGGTSSNGGTSSSGGTSSNGGFDAGTIDPYLLPSGVTISDAGVITCGTAACACANGIDDDADGKTDGFDEECTGAVDNDEGTFATGIPGDNSDPNWQDCFYDGNSGAGDDHCRYHAECLTGERAPTDPTCTITAECQDFCAARTPNGCDCFGCCAIQVDEATSVNVFIGEACSLENIGDTTACPRCTPSTACGNTCAECELCPGKSIEDLPETCGGGSSGTGGTTSEPPPPAYTCDAGQTVCGSSGECPGGEYCSLGCCLAFVIR